MIKKNQGFTLVELLLVVIIVGVLTVALLTVLNFARQQARARDGVLSTTFNKILTEIKAMTVSNVTGVLDYPSCKTLNGNMMGIIETDTVCTGDAYYGTATFRIGGVFGTATNLAYFKYSFDNTTPIKIFCLSVPLVTDDSNILRITQADGFPQLALSECF